MPNKKVVILPCSGLGKPLGTAGRLAAYRVVELRPEDTCLTCLALLDNQDEDALRLVRENRNIALDACPAQCATKIIEAAGGQVEKAVNLMEIYKQNRHLKPQSVLEMGEKGRELVEVIALAAAAAADKLLEESR